MAGIYRQIIWCQSLVAKEMQNIKGLAQFDKIFIFNSSLRFNLVSRLANIEEIYQYSLFNKTNQHIVQPAKDLIKKNLGIFNFPNFVSIFYQRQSAKNTEK